MQHQFALHSRAGQEVAHDTWAQPFMYVRFRNCFSYDHTTRMPSYHLISPSGPTCRGSPWPPAAPGRGGCDWQGPRAAVQVHTRRLVWQAGRTGASASEACPPGEQDVSKKLQRGRELQLRHWHMRLPCRCVSVLQRVSCRGRPAQALWGKPCDRAHACENHLSL